VADVTESPSVLLERAANALEAMSELAYNGPWRVDMLVSTCAIKTGEGSPHPGEHLATVGDRFNAAWIATMSPVVAAALINWLRDTADDLSVGPAQTSSEGYALKFARAVLGEHTEEESHA